MKKLSLIFTGGFLALAALAFGLVGPAQAADFLAPSGNDGNLTVSSSETHHNLYVAGGNVAVNSHVTGDLYAAGGSVSIDGAVDQDVTAAGGTVLIGEPVNGDVRVAGGQVTINAPVKGDVLAAGGTLILTEKAMVDGEVRVSGGSITVEGPVMGGVYVEGGTVKLNSKIDGEVKVQAAQSLTVGPNAVIANEISYIGKSEAQIDGNAKANVKFTTLAQHQKDNGKRTGFVGFLIGGAIIKFIAFMIAGLLFLHFFRGRAVEVTDLMYRKTWSSLGIGFVLAVAMPIAIILCLVVLVGYIVGFIALAAYALMAMVGMLLALIFLGAWIIKLITKKPTLVLDWQALALGTLLYMVLWFVPIAGWLVELGLFLIGFGALATTQWQRIRSGHAIMHSPE
jgi:hypothetical protein